LGDALVAYHSLDKLACKQRYGKDVKPIVKAMPVRMFVTKVNVCRVCTAKQDIILRFAQYREQKNKKLNCKFGCKFRVSRNLKNALGSLPQGN
jgi:hypothetical protein